MWFLLESTLLGCLNSARPSPSLRLFLEDTCRLRKLFLLVCFLLLVSAVTWYILVDGERVDGELLSGALLDSALAALGSGGSEVDGGASGRDADFNKAIGVVLLMRRTLHKLEFIFLRRGQRLRNHLRICLKNCSARSAHELGHPMAVECPPGGGTSQSLSSLRRQWRGEPLHSGWVMLFGPPSDKGYETLKYYDPFVEASQGCSPSVFVGPGLLPRLGVVW